MSTAPTAQVPAGDPLAERLERLAQRRARPDSQMSIDAASQRSARPSRHHAARVARLGALAVSVASAGGLTYLFADLNASSNAAQALSALPPPIATTPSTGQTAVTTSAIQAFNGAVVDTKYGPVEVQVQVAQGHIADVAVVQYPDGDGKSVRINAGALPTLRTETLTAQSAQIDTVSGATYTSDAYATSLQSAIDQARATGATIIA